MIYLSGETSLNERETAIPASGVASDELHLGHVVKFAGESASWSIVGRSVEGGHFRIPSH